MGAVWNVMHGTLHTPFPTHVAQTRRGRRRGDDDDFRHWRTWARVAGGNDRPYCDKGQGTQASFVGRGFIGTPALLPALTMLGLHEHARHPVCQRHGRDHPLLARCQRGFKRLQACRSFRCHQPALGEMPPEGVDGLYALPDTTPVGPERHRAALGLGTLHCIEPHVRRMQP